MATASAQSDCAAGVDAPAKEQECSVCYGPFCDPKLLRCGHLFCRQCLLTWVKSQHKAACLLTLVKSQHKVTCPLCRWPILKQEAGESQAAAVSSWTKAESGGGEGNGDNAQVDDSKLQALVDSFPTDLSMVARVEADRLLSQKTHKCHVCEDLQATALCLHCRDLLCGPCKKVHGKLTVSRHHVVEDLSTLTADRLAEFQRPTSCPQHPEEACRLFCPQHATSMCLLCASSQHRGCSDVKEFEKQAEEARKVVLEVMKTLESGETDLDLALAELEQHMAQVELKTEAALDEIRTLRDRLYKSVDNCCDRLELKTSEGRDVIREAVTFAKTILLGRKSRVGSHHTLAERLHDSKELDVVCCMTSVVQARVKDLELHVTLPESAKVITMTTLVVDQSAVQRVEQELAKLGEVKVERAKVAANAFLVPVKFHDRHGSHISLSNNNRTATRTKSYCHGVVVVDNPMAVGELTEVHIDEWDPSCGYGFTNPPGSVLGVLAQSPDTVTFESFCNSMRSTIVIYHSGVTKFGQQTWNIGGGLKNLGAGNRVGVSLDRNFSLHLHINGEDKGVFAANVPQPCYFLFDLNDFTKQVTLLSLKQVP